MNRTERFYLIHQMLRDRHTVSIDVFLKELGVSRATFKRDIEYLRDRLHAPIIWDRDARGYRFDDANQLGPAYALPGLWFSSGELYALLAAHKLLNDIEPGILAAHVAPLQARLASLLEASGHSALEVTQRVRLLSIATCGTKMRIVQGKEGKRDFWGCMSFPRCRQKLGMRKGASSILAAEYS